MRTLMTRRDRASQEVEGRRKTWVFGTNAIYTVEVKKKKSQVDWRLLSSSNENSYVPLDGEKLQQTKGRMLERLTSLSRTRLECCKTVWRLPVPLTTPTHQQTIDPDSSFLSL